MTYADTDFFLALIKETDWLKTRASRVLRRYRIFLWTSIVTIIELLLLSERFTLDPERVVMDALEIAPVRDTEPRTLLLAAHYMKENKLHTFDALHAAFAKDDEIISSDKAFDRIPFLKRIPL